MGKTMINNILIAVFLLTSFSAQAFDSGGFIGNKDVNAYVNSGGGGGSQVVEEGEGYLTVKLIPKYFAGKTCNTNTPLLNPKVADTAAVINQRRNVTLKFSADGLSASVTSCGAGKGTCPTGIYYVNGVYITTEYQSVRTISGADYPTYRIDELRFDTRNLYGALGCPL